MNHAKLFKDSDDKCIVNEKNFEETAPGGIIVEFEAQYQGKEIGIKVIRDGDGWYILADGKRIGNSNMGKIISRNISGEGSRIHKLYEKI